MNLYEFRKHTLVSVISILIQNKFNRHFTVLTTCLFFHVVWITKYIPNSKVSTSTVEHSGIWPHHPTYRNMNFVI